MTDTPNTSQAEVEKLAECPFCGTKPTLGTFHGGWHVQCNEPVCRATTAYHRTPVGATAAWNMRAVSLALHQRDEKIAAKDARILALEGEIARLREVMHPEILRAIADEIQCFEHSARCGSLRAIAKWQEAVLPHTDDSALMETTE